MQNVFIQNSVKLELRDNNKNIRHSLVIIEFHHAVDLRNTLRLQNLPLKR